MILRTLAALVSLLLSVSALAQHACATGQTVTGTLFEVSFSAQAGSPPSIQCPAADSGWQTSNTAVGQFWINWNNACGTDYTRTLTTCTNDSCNYTYKYNATGVTGSGQFNLNWKVTCSGTQSSACSALSSWTDFATLPGKQSPGAMTCMDSGCNARLAPTLMYLQDRTSGAWTTKGDVTYDGTGCTYSAGGTSTDATYGTSEPSATKDPCPTGQQATMNGVTVCQPGYNPNLNVVQSVSTSTSSTATSTTPSGSTTTTSTTASGTTTTSVTCQGQECTVSTSTTTKNADSSTTTGTASQSVSAAAYCKDNPTAGVCKSLAGSTFTGSCSGGFQCSGDAAACAAAQATWKTACAIDVTGTPEESTLYGQAKAGGTGFSLSTSTISISGANFDSSNALGTSSCITDLSVTVWGYAASLPLSQVCPHLQMLRSVLLGIAWLTAAAIVGKGVQG